MDVRLNDPRKESTQYAFTVAFHPRRGGHLAAVEHRDDRGRPARADFFTERFTISGRYQQGALRPRRRRVDNWLSEVR